MTDGAKSSPAARILICEGELLLAEDITNSLNKLGYDVVGKVSSGEEVLQQAEEKEPDLVLMDIILPGKIDGIEAATLIRRQLDVPVIYLTENEEIDLFERTINSDPYGYIGKTVSMPEMRRTIEMVLYRHRADRRLKESEARRAKAEELAGLHSWEWDLKTGHLVWSAESYRVFGLTPEAKLTFKSFIKAVRIEDRNLVKIALKNALDGKHPYDLEFRIVRPDAQERILYSRGEIERNVEGKPIRMHGMALDITERKRIENALRESESINRLLSETTSEAICFHEKGALLHANSQYFKMFGYDPHELIAQEALSKTLAPESLETVQRHIVIHSEERYEAVGQKKDGSKFPIEIKATDREFRGKRARAVAIRDLTERKKADEALHRSEHEKKLILNATTEMVAYYDPDLCIKWVNHAAGMSVGKQPCELVNGYCFEIWHQRSEPCLNCPVIKARETRKPQEGEVTTPDGRQWLLRAYPILNESDEITGLVEFGLDITERKQAEAEIKHLNENLGKLVDERTANLMKEIEVRKRIQADLIRSNRDLEQFAYVASHDLQEPLRSVANALQIIEKEHKGKLGGQSDLMIFLAVEQAKKMQALIRDLLDYSRIEARGHAFELVDMQAVLSQSVLDLKKLIEDKGAKVTCDSLPKVWGDPTQLLQVFQNLIGNALKFGREESSQVHVSAERGGREWVFSVKDNGIGIDVEYSDRIFEIFRQLDRTDAFTGTGIGLAIAKKIVERHRGRIWVESGMNVGSTFRFTIPVHGCQ